MQSHFIYFHLNLFRMESVSVKLTISFQQKYFLFEYATTSSISIFSGV